MTTTSAPVAAASSPARPPSSRSVSSVLAISIPVVVALVVNVAAMFQPHDGLFAYRYDSGVYLGASIRLSHLVLPYRDFTLLHPPGIAILMLPLAIVSHFAGTHVTIGLARIATVLVVVVNCGLVAWILRFKGAIASLVGGLMLALWEKTPTVDSALKLEPYLMLFCLLAFLFAFHDGRVASSRRVLIAGLMIGVAGSIKIWAIAPALVLLGCIVLTERARAGRFILGTVIGFCVIVLPFFVLAPSSFVHDVLITQMNRQNGHKPSPGIGRRISFAASWVFDTELGGQALVAWLVGAVVAVTYAIRFRRVTPFEWAALISSVAAFLFLLAPPEYFLYYLYFPVVFITLVLGAVAGSIAEMLRSLVERGSHSRPASAVGSREPLILAVITLVLVGLYISPIVSYQRSSAAKHDEVIDAAGLDAAIPPGVCVVSTDVFALISINRFVSDTSGCPASVDAGGEWLATPPGIPPPYNPPPASLVAKWHAWLAASDYVLTSPQTFDMIPWTPRLNQWFSENFTPVLNGEKIKVYRNDHPPVH